MGPTWVLSAPDGPHVGPINYQGSYGMDQYLHPMFYVDVITFPFTNTDAGLNNPCQ